MTFECVTTLLTNFKSANIKIIIVDNASTNGTGAKLSAVFSEQKQVHVILNEKNLGFAKGNNIGYEYAKQFKPDFVIVMNNDVLIHDCNFLYKVNEFYQYEPFAVLGPDIYNSKSKKHQNPLYINGNTKDTVIKIQKRLEKEFAHFNFYYCKNRFLSPIKSCIKTILFPLFRLKHYRTDRTKSYENAVLQGACYIFSKDFIESRAYAFYPETFLYFEEDILHLQCQQQNLKMVYCPYMQVIHLEDVSTNMILKTNFAKERMKTENLLHSMSEFIKLASDINTAQ